MPYFLRHYASFAERIIIYDDASDDGTGDIVKAAGAELRECPWSGLDDWLAATFASQQYREARGNADWVIWVDGDEFVYHPDIKGRLQRLHDAGITLPCVQGYTMFAPSPPTGGGQIYDECRNGVVDERYSKAIILDPDVEMYWQPGKHECSTNAVPEVGQTDPIKILHYRWLGRDLYLQRNQKNTATVSERNRVFGLGQEVYSPFYVGHHSLEWYESMERQAVECV